MRAIMGAKRCQVCGVQGGTLGLCKVCEAEGWGQGKDTWATSSRHPVRPCRDVIALGFWAVALGGLAMLVLSLACFLDSCGLSANHW